MKNQDASWSDEVCGGDSEWVEVKVTTSKGEVLYYRIPQRTHFEELDRLAGLGREAA